MKKYSFISLLLFFLGIQQLVAQELQVDVSMNGDRVQTQERQLITGLEKTIKDFMNKQEWSSDDFEDFERIKLNMQINLTANSSPAEQNYEADVQLLSVRPVYRTDYESPLFNYLDNDWRFSFGPSDPLVYTNNVYSTELVSLMSFYAYLVMGLDYDTFSMEGGTPFYVKAQEIANYSQQSGGKGWNLFGEKQDRIYLIDNVLSPQFKPFRAALYEYHRLGLDTFEEDPDNSRKVILQALKKIQGVRKNVLISIMLDSFFRAKSSELLNIFSQGDAAVIEEAVNILVEVDPSNANKYRKLM
ncbi:DUF4835 family protein [Algivirga pacifica]|uniref:DUF4835 family protein n=1 Tax=Algivirga pacifica TaxID=1162670 RepID=A0ABP9CWN0_9BACT